MELLAPIEALKKIPKGSKVQIFTDSKYVKSGITEWIHNWKKNGWKTANKKEKKGNNPKLAYWSNEGFKVYKGTYLIEDKSVNYVG